MPEEEKILIDPDDLGYESQEHKESLRVLVFSLAKEHYGMDVASAKEVFSLGSVTRVPNAPSFIKGVTNLHGQIIPLVDISFFLGIINIDMGAALKVIVMEHQSSLIGILVDKIEEATQILKEAIQPPLATLKGRLLDFTIGQTEFRNGILVYLDLKKILNCDEMKKLKSGGA